MGDCSVYLLLDTGVLDGRDALEVARLSLEGGVGVVQLRAKGWAAREQVALAQALLPLTGAYNVPLIINDHTDVALAVGAAGVHLGVDDLPVALARQIMPMGVIGYSPEGVADAQRAAAEGADYLGVGPFASTRTKQDAGAPIGAAGLAAIAGAVRLPVLAIGGLTVSMIPEAVAAGIVVGAALLTASDPTTAFPGLQQYQQHT